MAIGDDSADILFGLQLRLQRCGIERTAQHRNGLSAVARDLFRDRFVNSQWKKKLLNVDIAYNVCRHINRVGAEAYLQEFLEEIRGDLGQAIDGVQSVDVQVELEVQKGDSLQHAT